MKRLVSLLCLAGCQQTATLSTSAFVGTNDVVLADQLTVDGALAAEGNEAVNRYLVVTSTNTNELRVLDLKAPSATVVVREPLRGPNPLEPLSIPVLDRPTDLSLDTRYENGVRRKGALLYATRQGGSEVSIVGLEPNELREVRRLPVPAPVTAIANLMPSATTSRLFIATFDGAVASVVSSTMPASSKALRSLPTAQLSAALSTVVRLDGVSIVAMLALPGLPGRVVDGRPFCASSACLVVATRRLAGGQGTTMMLELDTLRVVALRFPGPVRALATIDRQLETVGADAPPAGAFVYGVLDEEACGGARCAGIAAVDTRATSTSEFGPLVVDGVASSPVRWSDGLVRGLNVVAGGEIAGLVDVVSVPLLGVMTMSNGEIVFFDAASMTLIEQETTASTLGPAQFSSGGAWVAGPEIVEGDASAATLSATIGDGAVRGQRVSIAWQGELGRATLTAVPTTSFVAPVLAARLQAGDALRFDGAGCVAATVTSVSGQLVQFTPASTCQATGVTATAGAGRPFVITGSIDGFLGRAAAGTSFTTGAPFIRVPGVPLADAKLVIPFGRQTDTQPPPAGATWSFEVIGNHAPLVSIVDPTLFTLQGNSACPTQLQLPGSLVYESVRGRVFFAYPSANVVAEFDSRRVIRGSIGPNQGVSCHR